LRFSRLSAIQEGRASFRPRPRNLPVTTAVHDPRAFGARCPPLITEATIGRLVRPDLPQIAVDHLRFMRLRNNGQVVHTCPARGGLPEPRRLARPAQACPARGGLPEPRRLARPAQACPAPRHARPATRTHSLVIAQATGSNVIWAERFTLIPRRRSDKQTGDLGRTRSQISRLSDIGEGRTPRDPSRSNRQTDLAALTTWVLAKTSCQPCFVGLLAVV
jgi:hypothetical protein